MGAGEEDSLRTSVDRSEDGSEERQASDNGSVHHKVCVCLLLQYLLQSCSRGGVGGGWRGEDMCYERLRAEASVN